MKYWKSSLAILSLLTLPGLSGSSALLAEEVDAQKLYQQAVKSCVFIVVPVDGGISMGSGSLIDREKKIVLTNWHVVDAKDFAFVQFPIYQKDGSILTDKKKYIANVPAGKAIRAKVLYRDRSRDLAFIQLDKVPPGTPAMKLAKKSVGVAATTWNIGSPGAVEQVFSITKGEVRGVGIEKFMVGDGAGLVFEVRAKVVTTTNPSNQGDSGGPLINKYGEQVAVTQSGKQSAQLVNRFIDVMEVRAYLNEKKITIKEDGPVAQVDPDPMPKVTPIPKKDTDPPAKGVGTPPTKVVEAGPSDAEEKEASELLRRSRLFARGEDYRPTYVAKLKEIIKKYPGTTAAKDAKRLLDNLD